MENFSKDSNILVTGGYGFIGGNLIKMLNKLGFEKIFNFDKLTYASSFNFSKSSIDHLVADHLQLDLYERSEVSKAIKTSNPDLIFNIAAETHVDRSIECPIYFINSNIIGTFNILEESRIHWKNLSKRRKSNFKFIHISTDEVYGNIDSQEFANEQSPYNPNSPYAASKASSDHLARAWFKTYGLPTIITNCSNNYGPYQFPEKLIPKIIVSAIKGLEIPIYGEGKQIRDWIFVEDHVKALIKCADYGISGEKYCIAGNNQISNIDLVKKIFSILEILLPPNSSYFNLLNFVEDRPGHDFRYAIDSQKIIKNLNWNTSIDFMDGLEITVNWYLKNYKWLNEIYKSGYDDKRIGLIN